MASDIGEGVNALAGAEVATLTGDIADEATASRTVALALERFGRLDVLVNNAGCTLNKALVETSTADWDAVMAVNARGNFLHAREAVRVMAARGDTVLSVASIVSVVA